MSVALLQLTKSLSWDGDEVVRNVYNLQWAQHLLKYIEQNKHFLSPVAMKLTDALEIEVTGIFDINLLYITKSKHLDFWFKSKVRVRRKSKSKCQSINVLIN